MRIVKPCFEMVDKISTDEVMKKLELCARVCYKSEDKIAEGSAETLLENIIKRGHESVLEHYSFSVRFICSRDISHEIVRHRLSSYSQESQRFIKYSDMEFICPLAIEGDNDAFAVWKDACYDAGNAYKHLLQMGYSPQYARSILPNCTKTELVMTANIREWRHFLTLRCSKAAHPEMRRITIPLLEHLTQLLPVLFCDIAKMITY